MHIIPDYTKPFLRLLLLGGVLLAGSLAGCKKNNTPASGQTDPSYYSRQAFIVSLDDDFVLLDTALSLTGMRDTLAQPGPFTTFAPDNNALNVSGWGYYSNGVFNGVSLPSNAKTALMSLIVRGTYKLSALPVARNLSLMSMAGLPLFVSKYVGQGDTSYTVNGAPVTIPDFPATNGPLEEVDAQFPNLVAYATTTDYVNSQPSLSYLAVALLRTGLDKVLAGSDTLTLLAITNSAFQNSSDPSLSTLEGLEAVDTAKLARILRYHIIPNRDFIYDFNWQAKGLDTLKLPTLQGETVSFIPDPTGGIAYMVLGSNSLGYGGAIPPTPITFYNGTYYNGGITDIDVPTGNGVIHQLNGILLP